MRAALGVLVRAAPARAVDLAVDLTGLWETRHVAEGREWVQRALDAGGDELAPATRASGLWTAAMLAHYQGDDDGRAAAGRGRAWRRRGPPATPLTLARALYIEALSVVTDAPAATARYREEPRAVRAPGRRCRHRHGVQRPRRARAGGGRRSTRRARSTSGRWGCGARAATPAACPARRTTSGRRCSLAASSTAPRALLLEALEASRGHRRPQPGRRGPGGPGGGGRRAGAERGRRHAARRGAGGARGGGRRARAASTRSRFALREVGAARGARRRALRRGRRARPRGWAIDERRRLAERVAGRCAGAAARRAHQARAGGRPPDGGGPHERRDRRAPGGQRAHGAPPRVQHPGQARRALAAPPRRRSPPGAACCRTGHLGPARMARSGEAPGPAPRIATVKRAKGGTCHS